MKTNATDHPALKTFSPTQETLTHVGKSGLRHGIAGTIGGAVAGAIMLGLPGGAALGALAIPLGAAALVGMGFMIAKKIGIRNLDALIQVET